MVHSGIVRASYVYIMASRSRTLYTGVTNNLERRVLEHKRHLAPGFTSRYRIERLVYFETWGRIRDAIGREKQVKSWRRSKKVNLIESQNPAWADLSEGWYGARQPAPVVPSFRTRAAGEESAFGRSERPEEAAFVQKAQNKADSSAR